MFKLVLDAGHGYQTAGKRCTIKGYEHIQEYSLNKRITNKIYDILKNYNVDILVVDSTEQDVPLKTRTNKANKFGANLYLSIHHNAGINGGKGGGIMAFAYKPTLTATVAWQKDFYNEIVKNTGLKGNRSTPIAYADLHVLRETKMSAVLLECGFMDSTTDTPIIVQDSFADKVALSCASVIIHRAKLTPKSYNAPKKKSLEEVANEVIKGVYGNGNTRKKKLAELGYDYKAVQAIVNARLKK